MTLPAFITGLVIGFTGGLFAYWCVTIHERHDEWARIREARINQTKEDA